MQVYDSPNTTVEVPHGMGPGSRLYLADVWVGKRKTRFTFVMMANSSRDARARLKRNAMAAIKVMTDNHWENSYRKLEERTLKMRQVIAAIKNNKIKLTELSPCRVYPVSYFDDTRSVC